ncbi:unnamed protein product [Sphagnum balticum]
MKVEAADVQLDSETTLERLTSFFEEALASSHEGLMGKSLDDDATYMASKRSNSWLKVKRDYVEGLHDTLDLVPIGAWHGNGCKAGWQVTLILYNPCLLAYYDPDHLTISPVHQAGIGLVHLTCGISMRFLRFISMRTDKNPETASSPSDIADLFNHQIRKLDIENPSTLGKQEGDSD